MSGPHDSTSGVVGRRQFSVARRAASVIAVMLALTLLGAACSSDEPAVDQASEAVEDAGSAADALLAETTDDLIIDARSAEIAEALRNSGATSLATMIETVDFDQLTDSAEFTFFAPNDDAFLELSADETADLLSNPNEVIRILRTHVASERIDAAELATRSSIDTESGTSLEVVATGDVITVGGATVTTADVGGAGGLVHVIDAVLLP